MMLICVLSVDDAMRERYYFINVTQFTRFCVVCRFCPDVELSHREEENQSDLQDVKGTKMSTNNVNGKVFIKADKNSLSKSVDALREVLGEGARIDVTEDRFSCKVSFSLSTMDDINEIKIASTVKEILKASKSDFYGTYSGDLSFIDLREVINGGMPKINIYDLSESPNPVVEYSDGGGLYVDRDAFLEFGEEIVEV